MSRKRVQTKSKIVERLETMSPEEMQQRWAALRPRYVRWLAFFIVVAVTLFTVNRVEHFSQGVVNIINVGFQISCIFAVMFAVMTAMSLVFGRATEKVKG